MQGEMHKLGANLREMILPLQGVCEVVAVGEEETRSRQHSLDHGHVLLVVTFLAAKEREGGG